VKLATVLFVLWLVLPPSFSRGKLPRKSLVANGAPGSEGKPAKGIGGEIRQWRNLRVEHHQPSLTPYLPAKRRRPGQRCWSFLAVGIAFSPSRTRATTSRIWLSEHGIAAFVLKHGSRARPTRLTRSKSRR